MDLLDDSVALTHFLNARRQDQGDDRRKALRDDCHRKRNGDHEGLDHFGVIDQDLADEHQHAQHDTGDAQHQGDLVQILLERRLLLRDAVKHAGDLADLCVIADLFDNAFSSAVFHKRRHMGSVFSVRKRCALVTLLPGVLLHGDRLAGQGGLIYLQRTGLRQFQIRGYDAPRLQDDVVPRNQFLRGDLLLHAVADNDCRRHAEALQRLNRFLRGHLLHRSDHAVGDHDDGDDHGVDHLSRREGDCRGYDQQKDQR